jgi:DNA-binding NarL/FixJ family response regulator
VTKDAQTAPVVPDHIRPPIRTLVVDDSVTLLERLCRLLEAQPLIEVVGTAKQGNEALHMAEVMRPDLVLMDLNMPFVDGLQATAILRRRLPDIRVIIMSVDDNPEAQAAARAHGAHGFIWKPRMRSDLLTEIRRAFQVNLTDDERSTL